MVPIITVVMFNLWETVLEAIELKLGCEFYQKQLDECPSGSETVSKDDIENLKKYCCSKFKECAIYQAQKKESSAA